MLTWILDKLSKIPHGAAVLKENQELKDRNAELEAENEQLRQKMDALESDLPSDHPRALANPEVHLDKPEVPLSRGAIEILVALFDTSPAEADAKLLSSAFEMKHGVIVYHLEELQERGLIFPVRREKDNTFWKVSSEGRKHVIENRLHE